MSKHTPGPWYADKEGYIYRRPLSELYEYGGKIAGDKPLAAAWKGWYEEGQTGYPVQANAHLIAAAPEMYELLKSIDHALHLDLMNFDATDHRQVYDYAKNIRVLLDKIERGGE